MLSEKQLIANRNNCLKSTGPRTPEGKRSASRNAVRHGLLSDSAEVLLKGENPDEFESFHQNLLTNLDPQGQLEVLLAERITGFFWKLKRAGRMEKGLLDILCNPSSDSDPSSKKSSLPFIMIMTKTYDNPSEDPEYQEFKKLKEQQTAACGLDLSEGKIVDKESFDSIQALQTPEKQPSPMADNSSAESLGKAVQHDFKSGSLLERLLRYEGQIERGLYRALTELQKFQFLRRRNDAVDTEAQNTEKPNEAISADNVAEASSFGNSLCHPCDLSAIALATAEGGDPDSSLDSLSRLSETKTEGPLSMDSKSNEPILADNVSESHVAQPPSAVVNVDDLSLPKGEASLLHNEKPNEAILEIQAPSVPVASKRSEDGSEGIEVLHNIHNNNPNQSSLSKERNQLPQDNSGNIQSTIDNLQSTESVVPVSPEPEKPNEAILAGNVAKSHVAQPPSAVVNVDDLSLPKGEASLLHNEKPNEAIFQQADASGAKQPAAGSPNPDTGYFYHSPPCRLVSPQQYASHGATSLSHLSDEQLQRLAMELG